MLLSRWLCLGLTALPLLLSRAAFAQAPEPQPAQPPAPQPPPSVSPPPTAPPPTSPPPAEPPPSPYDPSMQAGGLKPPPPMDPKQTQEEPKPADQTQDHLDKSKEKDSGRGLSFVWLNVEGGYQTVGLQTFNIDEQNFTAGFIEQSANGPVIGAGVGARLLFITVGARGRLGLLNNWQFFTVGGEVGFHIPIGRLEPRFSLGGGYAAVGSFDQVVTGGVQPDISIRGFYARAGGGMDYFITNIFSIGASVSWEFTALTRPGFDPTKLADLQNDIANIQSADIRMAQQKQAELLAFEGSGYGSAFTVTGVLGLHF